MDERDGEVICLTDGTKLNREDLLCWRCGGRNLDRSRVELALSEPFLSTDNVEIKWWEKWFVDSNLGILCRLHRTGLSTPIKLFYPAHPTFSAFRFRCQSFGCNCQHPDNPCKH